MLFVGTSIIHPSTEGVFLLCNILDLLIYSIEEKCIVLYEVLHFFQCQSAAADLKLIGGSGRAGILCLNKNITDCSRIEMIHQSPTGIYEQTVDLNAL